MSFVFSKRMADELETLPTEEIEKVREYIDNLVKTRTEDKINTTKKEICALLKKLYNETNLEMLEIRDNDGNIADVFLDTLDINDINFE